MKILNKIPPLKYSEESGFRCISETITLLRFPLAVVILLLHSSFEHEIINGVSIFQGWNSPIYHHLDFILVSNICNIAVPLFFMISGFLFFKEGYLTSELYKSKIHKRIKTILVPYLIWNVIICLFYFFVQNIAPSMNSGRNKLIADYSVQDFFMMFWSMSYIKEGGMNGPMDTPLWFIRDLMVMMLASPFVYIMIKKANGLLPFFALAFYISGIWVGVPGFSSVALAFFSLGAFFAIKKWNFVIISRKCFIYILPLYAVLLIALVLANDFTIEIPTYAKHLLVLIGVFMCVGTASVVVEKKWICINSFLAGSTFFIFASHCELLKVFIRLVSSNSSLKF